MINFKYFFFIKKFLFIFSSDWNINNLLMKWNLKCIEVPLNSFGADKFNVAGSDLPGLKTISLYIISYFSPKIRSTDDSLSYNCKLMCCVNKHLL